MQAKYFIWFHFFLCTSAMVWPGALLANRIEPFVLGLPFFIFWYILWMFILFLGTWIAYMKIEGGGVNE